MHKPLRVLHVVGGLDFGGVETFLMSIYRHLDRSRIQFDFVMGQEFVLPTRE